jgi:hypothetical protein
MSAGRPITILCVSSYEKGQEFLRTCKRMGCTVLLLTVEKLRDADWPRDSIDELFFTPGELPIAELISAVSYAARSRHIDRIVALDEFDLENVPGMAKPPCVIFETSWPCAREPGKLGCWSPSLSIY